MLLLNEDQPNKHPDIEEKTEHDLGEDLKSADPSLRERRFSRQYQEDALGMTIHSETVRSPIACSDLASNSSTRRRSVL